MEVVAVEATVWLMISLRDRTEERYGWNEDLRLNHDTQFACSIKRWRRMWMIEM